MKIGVITDCFKKSHEEGIKIAAKLGLDGVQIYATTGAFSPDTLSDEKKAEYKKLLKDNGLVVSALCGDMGGYGFEIEADNALRVEKTKKIIDLAVEFGSHVVTTHIGVVPQDSANPRYKIMQDACGELAAYADSVGAHFAIETGPEPAKTLRGFLDSLNSRGVAVNLDPANLTMVCRDDAVAAVHTLKDYIVHTHAKDGRQMHDCDPEIVYGIKPRDPSCVTDESFIELPLGEGDVPFPAYLKALDEVGYRGFLTIEREVGENPAKDIATAVDFLKNIIG